MKAFVWVIASLVVPLVLVTSPLQGQNQPLVVEGGTLIDGTGRDPIPASVIVIEGSRIKAVGTKGNLSYPAQARVIRAEGKTVLPGLIDSHIHLSAYMHPLFLHFGVTTVFDTANPTDWILAQREALKRGKIKGPRLFATGAIIGGPPEHSNPVTLAGRLGYLIQTRTPQEARLATRNLIDQGVDGIKVYESLSIESLKAVIEEADKAGLPVVGHVIDAREATLVGMKYMEHVRPIIRSTLSDSEMIRAVDEGRLLHAQAEMDTKLFGPLIELLVNNGVYFNPTLTRPEPESRQWYDVVVKLLKDPSAQFITEARRQHWLRAVEAADTGEDMQVTQSLRTIREFIRRFVQAGGKVLTGPDTGARSSATNIAGLAMHVEMEALVNAGLTPMQAILASTKWSAESMGKERDLGSVEPGKLADLILIEGDPLADIRVTQNVSAVILDGQVVETRLDPNFRNPLPRNWYINTPLEYEGPEISTMTPGIARAGDTGVTIRVTGRRFNPQSFIRFDTIDLPTRVVSNSVLTARVEDTLLNKVGTYAVTVVNPGSGGSPSNPTYFIVNFPEE